MMPTLTTTIESPIGPLLLSASQGALTGVQMQNQRHFRELPDGAVHDDAWFADIVAQLDSYFSGELREFDITLNLVGTDFQRRVWAQLQAIPYGETISYGELAARVGNAHASRAVGLANGKNPVSIIVPCHRVIGADGSLTGYGGGLGRKTWLLAHEAAPRREP
ncbi:MAG TPA: methylated-DNA--[protein]-cysteine S-methyltransferase [Acidimicrobiales bacterium]